MDPYGSLQGRRRFEGARPPWKGDKQPRGAARIGAATVALETADACPNHLAHGADSTPAGAWCYLAPVAFDPMEGRTMTTSNATVPVPAGEDAEPSPPAKRKGALPTVSGGGPSEWNDSLVAGIAQVCAGSDLRGDDMGAAAKRARAGLAAMTGIGPGDVIADMVAAQLVSAHVAAMDCYRRAAGGDLPLEVWRESMNQVNKLSRTSAALVEALNRHRGKSGQQTVRVEHVTVKDGGQAVIGPVATGGGGRG